jgi:hypothetical protein
LIVHHFDQVVDAWVCSTKKVNASYSWSKMHYRGGNTVD